MPHGAEEVSPVAAVTVPPVDMSPPQAYEATSGGAGTTERHGGADVFRQPSETLPKVAELDFLLGEALFDKLWVASPSSTRASDGLGPIFNARSCARCHPGGGRGHAPAPGEAGFDGQKTSMFLKLSVPAPDAAVATALEAYLSALDGAGATPGTRAAGAYGVQLQDRAVLGHAPEAKWSVTYDDVEVALEGGETARLRRPTYEIGEMQFGPMPEDLQLSPRVGNPMIGLGLLAAIPEAEILALSDPEDANGDGISGRANWGWSIREAVPMLGRFGWKALNPTVEQQVAAAFSGDLGLSTPLFPSPAGDCTAAQTACLAGPHGDGDARIFEVGQTALDLVTDYASQLGVPARADSADPEVMTGQEIFARAGCAACHHPRFSLSDETGVDQNIWPYSDLLLHDMGPELADGRPEARATGREWRTAPLWGIGLTQQVSGHTEFLHDGRARTLLEAVLWHGGEAEAARQQVIDMPPADRAALIRFLESL